ncbi:hypothetical protein [Streptomyces sp. 43Y-GA-1]|uniref:hypothetical protein n=1 Tax=Streptomyces sp. 43Y-GA-1 TaxID=2939435 RepID=UPI0020BDB414|nr:hypothetical protein [Streptomyces sp. 43Y-GA-1]MCL6293167.1 hypothetical protein [Streptomyces sp. 43Y-GA-1]
MEAYYFGKEIRLPLDKYTPSSSERKRFTLATDMLSASCMKRFNLDWPERNTSEARSSSNARRYGVIDHNQVKEFGYGTPLPGGISRKMALQEEKKRIDAVRKLPQATRNIYTGENIKTYRGRTVPTGGCRGEAYRKAGLQSLEIPFSGDVARMQNRSWEASRRSPIVTEAAAKWRTCMKSSGFDYATPEAAVADPRWIDSSSSADSPSDVEVATASADVECKKRVLFVEKWYEIESREQNLLLEINSNRLASAKFAVNALARKVDAILEAAR